jgi:hypothetical protein
MDVEFSCYFSQRNASVMVHQSFETSSLTGREFSLAATPGFVRDEIRRVVLMDDIVNSLVGNISSDKVIYAYDFLSVRDRSVMSNKMRSARYSPSERVILTKKERERVNTHKMEDLDIVYR